jgi:hypothetical protein
LKAAPTAADPSQPVPLCVDLDGTLIRTDTLWESMVRLLRRNPLSVCCVLIWWLGGRARLKREIGQRVDLDPASLPYHAELMDFIRSERASGRRILLVTASDSKLANRVAQHVNLFHEVLASDGSTNLRGPAKSAKLVELFGERGFDYAGDSSVDFPVWAKARQAIVVTGNATLIERARQYAPVGRVFSSSKFSWTALCQEIRPLRWIKNLVVFVPLLAAHGFDEPLVRNPALFAFLALCGCASAVYLLNDLANLDEDRADARNRGRPFAAGRLLLQFGLFGFPILFAIAALLASRLPWQFAAALGAYLLLALRYPWHRKYNSPADVGCAAGRYTARYLAGFFAIGLPCSWLPLVIATIIFGIVVMIERYPGRRR